MILSDFNLPNINCENCTTTAGSDSQEFKFIKRVKDCFLTHHIREITRHRGEARESVLDLIFISEEIVEDIQVDNPIGRSDHVNITCTC